MKKIANKDLAEFDFLDFGANLGGSIEFAKARLFGNKGLGVDINPVRVNKMKKAGYDCIEADLCDLRLPKNCVSFVLMSHILEHLPNLKAVESVIANAKKVAKDYIVITGPFFDGDIYLKKRGFKFHWSDYLGHTCHLTIPQLHKILKHLGLNDFLTFVRYPIACSEGIDIHPITSPPDQKQYNRKIHPPKKHVTFDGNVFTDFVCYVRLRKNIPNWEEITKGYKNAIPYAEKNKAHIQV